jgi:hypothetical protein
MNTFTIYFQRVLAIAIFCFGFNAQSQPGFMFAKQIGAKGYDRNMSIALDATNNIYTIGRFEDTVDFDPGPGVLNLISKGLSDAYISKLDASGNFLWVIGIGGTGWDLGASIKTDASGNVYCIGTFSNSAMLYSGAGPISTITSNGFEDIYVVKLNSSGALVWVQTLGGNNQDYGASLTVDGGGNVFITGSFNQTADFDPGPGTANLVSIGGWDIFVTKLDMNGNFVWAQQFGGFDFDNGKDIEVNFTGEIFVTGDFIDTVDFDPGINVNEIYGKGGNDAFLMKLDANGNLLWVRQQGGTGSDCGTSLAVDDLGNIYNSGIFEVMPDLNPGPPVATFTSNGEYDVFISKLDGAGDFQWAIQIGGTGIESGVLALDAAGANIYAFGTFESTVDFDPGASTYNLSTAGADAFYISKLTNAGNFVCAGAIKGSGETNCAVALDANGNIYTAGGFAGTVDFDPSASTYTMTSAGLNDAFIAKLSNCLNPGIKEMGAEHSFVIYPNPSTGKLKIEAAGFKEIMIYDILGNLIHKESFSQEIETIDLSGQPEGVYFAKLITQDKRNFTKRIILH